MELTVTTQQGLEDILANEIRALGGKEVKEVKRAVRCEGDLEFIYRANLCLRTGLRVLMPIHTFSASDEGEFYTAMKKIHWPDYFKVNQCFAIHAVVNSTTFTHSRFMALKAKDAIVDQFRDIFGRRPNVSTYDPDLIINVHINQELCNISIDSSGESLHKRSYKVALHEAPLNEVLAAGLLSMTDFENYASFHDPMCGSGTLISEALMMHTRTPANFSREDFAFMKWKNYEQHTYHKIKEEMMDQIIEPTIHFSGADIERKYMFAAKKNITQLPYGEGVDFYKRDFFKDDSVPKPEFLIMNPPYDVRLESDDIDAFYAEIGTKLKHSYTNSRACIFSGNLEALKNVGLKTSSKRTLLAGALPAKLHIYDLYSGSKKVQD